MKLLNVGCGSVRNPSSEWVNLDNLRTQLPLGTGARIALDSEGNYVEHDLSKGRMPFPADLFDGVLLAHCLEHFPTPKGVSLLEDCFRLLKPGGTLLVSVPDAAYFRKVYDRDKNENWMELFDINDPNNGHPTWMRAALFYEQHEVVFTEDSLWCYLVRAGFQPSGIHRINPEWLTASHEIHQGQPRSAMEKMSDELDRIKFSVVMKATKS